jgi:hypothetical protein
MKKLLVLAALTLLLGAGTATVMTVHSQQAVACENSQC